MQRLHRIVVLGALHVSIWCSLTALIADLAPWLIDYDPYPDLRLGPVPEGVGAGPLVVETLAKLGFAVFLEVAKPLAGVLLLFSLIYRSYLIRGEPRKGELPRLARFLLSLLIVALSVASLFQLFTAAVSYLHFHFGTWQGSLALSVHEREPLFQGLISLILSMILGLAGWSLWWETIRGAKLGKGAFGQDENLGLAIEVLTIMVFLVGLSLLYACGLMSFCFYSIFEGVVSPIPGTEEFSDEVRTKGPEFVFVMATTAFFLMTVLLAAGFGLRLLGSGFGSGGRES